MRIAYFTDSFLPNVNGVSFSVDSFSRILALENEITIYAPAYKWGDQIKKRGKLRVEGYRSFALPTYKDIHVAIPNVIKVLESVEKFNPDVIHVHTPFSMGLTGILAAKRNNIPLLATYHTLFSETLDYISIRRLVEKYVQIIDHFLAGSGVNLDILKIKYGHEKDEKIQQKITWKLVNKIYSYSDLVICPSQVICDELKKRDFEKPVIAVSNGVDLEQFYVNRKTINKGQTILHVGRLSFEKNVNVVLEAFALVLKQCSTAKLVIAGGGPALEDLKRLSVKLGVNSSVKWLGMIARNKLVNVYNRADVFVTASTMETQGMVVLEAMACGLPIVGVNKYALKDLIKNTKNGYIVSPGDVRLLADRLRKILVEKELRKRMGDKSLQIVKGHDIRLMTDKLMGIYTDCVNERV